MFKSHDFGYQYQEQATPTPNIGFSKVFFKFTSVLAIKIVLVLTSTMLFQAMNGFMMMMTQNGKLLYISENAAEYLGHSMVCTIISCNKILIQLIK